jgi:hypothetical protein
VVLSPLPDLHTAEVLTLVLDEIRKRFGDTMGYELAITPDEATLARPHPTDEQSKLIYSFDRGWGDPSTRPRSDTDDLTDLAAFDVTAAAAALQAAPETLRIAPSDVTETFVDIDHIAEPPGPGALELLVRVSTTAHTDGWIYLEPAGTVKRVEDPSCPLRSSTWRRGKPLERGQKTATVPTPARYSTARSPKASCRWRNTGNG